jgi:hypothetical protein
MGVEHMRREVYKRSYIVSNKLGISITLTPFSAWRSQEERG